MAEELDTENRLAAAEAAIEDTAEWVAELVEAYVGERPQSLAAGLDSLGELLRLGLWLHAEAVWKAGQNELKMADAETEFGSAMDEVDRAERENNDLRREVSRLRREVEFEANADPLTGLGASRRDNLSYPLCACLTPVQLASLLTANEINAGGAQWTPPQCAVHPEEDVALLAVAEARVAADTGERHSLDDVAREFGVDLDSPSSSVLPDGDTSPVDLAGGVVE